MAESLLPGTDAIKKSTLEWDTYRGGYLVRYKDRNGVVYHLTTRTTSLEDWKLANEAFEKYLAEMKRSLGHQA